MEKVKIFKHKLIWKLIFISQRVLRKRDNKKVKINEIDGL